ncbi:MAG: methyltransferase family protein [Egibacteraceae bacterium]
MHTRLGSTSTRTFLAFPGLLAAEQALTRRTVRWRWLPLLVWGYGQYRLSGSFRTRVGGGGPGLRHPPERLVTTGIYRFSRNPMYLGHQIFLAGLALMTRSPLAAAVFAAHVPWFDARAKRDEAGLAQRFGEDYEAYRRRVPRWLPALRLPASTALDNRTLNG